ncbi:RNA polymerase subunit sigma-24 [Actinotalea sp. BY-33]|uniref:RNA polymerase subunit sigma-24 n=1 Tax=Actinotalea soli TaxID=2819234 RepID=A0A939LS76_9CELL|nr:DUF6596 domain-containing protein [Actinotalea soli]MBO1752898.1 RNA polymerase subunit sigma-24 [Actinotalea soli]
MTTPPSGPHEASAQDDPLARAWREHWGRTVALLLGQFARPDLVEDAVAEAFASAAQRWPQDGVPDSPGAWLLTAARRRVVDRLRAEAVHRRKEPLMVVDARTRAAASASATDPSTGPAEDEHLLDERLRLIFTCCHPALSAEARVALTLRFVIGLDVPEIARLMLVRPTTMAARITRAKKRLTASGIPFDVPPAGRLDERLDVVATVLYLVFTAGYHPQPGDEPLRGDLGDEAIRLARVLDSLLPGHGVVRALLALMLLQHSRRDARLDPDGHLVLLHDQDRSRWRRTEIEEALPLLRGLPRTTGQAEAYRLQALVAAEHATAPAAASTRWDVIAGHYAELEDLTGSPVVRLARAVAVAELDGPDAALALLEGLETRLPDHHRLEAVRAELAWQAGRPQEAAAGFLRALALVPGGPEHEHLTERLAALRTEALTPEAEAG